MIIVLGLYKGGSSAVAGTLHHMGVCMGHNLKSVPGYPTYEDWSIRNACVECYGEPDGLPRGERSDRVAILRRWLDSRKCRCGTMGVKYPMLCQMGPEMVEAWGNGHRLVSVQRDPDRAAASLKAWWRGAAAPLIRKLHAARAEFLANRPHVVVDYDALCADPADECRALASRLRLDVTPSAMDAAVAHIQRKGAVHA